MKILFVCSGNAHRSPLAEALLRKLRPDLEVDSAGTHVAIPIAEEARRFLAKENAEQYLKETPESLNIKQPDDYDLIVAMERKHEVAVINRCPGCKSKMVVWNIEDPYFLPHDHAEGIYMQIKEKVEELSSSL